MADSSPSFFSESLDIGVQAYGDTTAWLWKMLSQPMSEHNYFYGLVLVSALVYAWELLCPWRKQQSALRKDFWLDFFYMFFNFFLFSLLIYAALSAITLHALHTGLEAVGYNPIQSAATFFTTHVSSWQHLLLLFIVRDFIQWCIHRCLHRFPCLWRFHQVHHSVQEMGFAAHLRFHWMEYIIYNLIQFIPLACLGFGLVDFFVLSMFATAIGHLNHANLRLPLGPLRYIFNNPQMHIWHHSKEQLTTHPQGINFGLSLSCWDYLFGTAHIPSDGRDIPLGFEGIEDYPSGFIGQALSGFRRDS